MAAAQRNHGLRGWLSTVRSALDGPAAGRLQLSLSTSPQPPGPVQAVQDAAPGAATAGGPASPTQVQPAAAAEQERLLRRGSSGVAAAAAAAAAEAGQAQDAALDGEPLAAAAEQHRLASAGVDLRAVATGLERGLPYVALLLLLFAWQHIVGLSVFAFLSYLLQRVNAEVRSQVALKSERKAAPLLGAAALLAAQAPVVLIALRSRGIAGNMVLAGSVRPTQFWEVVFAVVVADTLLRYLAVLAKVAVLLAMPVDSPAKFRRRGRCLTAVEYAAGLYRMLPPTPLWYAFFAAQGGPLLGTALSGAYLLVKLQQAVERAGLVWLAVRQVAARGHGTVPTAQEIQEAGNCPICYQDAMRDPVRLPCGHLFCSDCLGEWLERERSCPMCRAAVGPANKRFKSSSDGGTPLFPTLF